MKNMKSKTSLRKSKTSLRKSKISMRKNKLKLKKRRRLNRIKTWKMSWMASIMRVVTQGIKSIIWIRESLRVSHHSMMNKSIMLRMMRTYWTQSTRKIHLLNKLIKIAIIMEIPLMTVIRKFNWNYQKLRAILSQRILIRNHNPPLTKTA